MEILSTKNLAVHYGDFSALAVDKEIVFNTGDRIGIIGANGAGKSTFVKAICGLCDYTGKVKTKLKHADIALHTQENNYVKRIPVRIIIEAALNTKIKDNKPLQELIKYLDFEKCLHKSVGQLSGGQKQKLTIVIVLTQDKQLTFFDEVTSALDFETRQKLMQKVSDWYKGRENTVCVVSHYYDELEALCNKLLIIDKGKVLAFDTIENLFSKYCGFAVITIKNTAENMELIKKYEKFHAPEHLIALKVANKEQETEIISLLTKNYINFKRSDNDIEILFTEVQHNETK
jgi:ABC-2 type transport system ATP-binding protein